MIGSPKLTNADGTIIDRSSLPCALTPEAALTLSTVWACARLIARSFASLPCGVFENDANGDKILQRDSELYKLLKKSPNADMTPFDFWVAIIMSVLFRGNAYALKTYSGKRLISIEPLLFDRMDVRENRDGSYSYFYHDASGIHEYYEDKIIHFKGLTSNGKMGLSVLGYAALSIGSALSMESSSSSIYQKGMTKTGVLTVDKTLTPEQRKAFKDNIAGNFSNIGKTGATLVLEGGMKFEALDITPKDLELIQSRGFSIEEICRWFGVPPVLIGHNVNTTSWGTGVEQINLAFLTYTMQPMIISIEQEMNKSLIAPADRDRLFVEFNIDSFLRADSTGRAALYSSASQNGWMKRSEIRKKENLPYVEGSDKLTVQSALVNLDDLGKDLTQGTIEDSSKV